MAFATSRSLRRAPENGARCTARARRRNGHPLLGLGLIAPSFVILVLVAVAPIAYAVYLSFTNYSILGGGRFTGVDNYERIAGDPSFWAALRNTLVFTLVTVPTQTALALLIAAVLARVFRPAFRRIVQSALFLPAIVAAVTAGTIWRVMLATDGGTVNELLTALGLPDVDWLGQTTTAGLSVCIVIVWKNVGYFLVIYQAAVLSVPEEQYEAASLDGAGGWRSFRHITLPALRPVTFLVLVLGTIWSFQTFDLVYTLTGGGPGTATSTLVYLVYTTGLEQLDMGYASAIAFVLLLVILCFAVIQRRIVSGGER